MKIKNIEFRLPWTRYVDMPIEADIYLAIRKSVLEDVLREVEEAANRVYGSDVEKTNKRAVTEEKSTASVWPEDVTCEGYCVK